MDALVAADIHDVTATYVYKVSALPFSFFSRKIPAVDCLLQSVNFFSRSSAFPKSDIVNNKSMKVLFCVSEVRFKNNSKQTR